MENAADGLVIAGSLLVGIVVASLFVYLFSNMGSMSKEFQEKVDESVVQNFNEPFEKYVGRDDLTAHDLLTVYNMANEANTVADMKIVTVVGINNQDIKNLSAFLSNGKKYACSADKVQYSEETRKISYIEFKEIK